MDLDTIRKIEEAQPEELDTGPVVVLNLVKFKSKDSLSIYLEYAARVLEAFGDRGLEVIYAGTLKEQLQGDIGDWDAVLLIGHPNRRLFYEMIRSEEYQAISPLREKALDNGVIWPSDPVMPYKTQTFEFKGGQWLDLMKSQHR